MSRKAEVARADEFLSSVSPGAVHAHMQPSVCQNYPTRDEVCHIIRAGEDAKHPVTQAQIPRYGTLPHITETAAPSSASPTLGKNLFFVHVDQQDSSPFRDERGGFPFRICGRWKPFTDIDGVTHKYLSHQSLENVHAKVWRLPCKRIFLFGLIISQAHTAQLG